MSSGDEFGLYWQKSAGEALSAADTTSLIVNDYLIEKR
jgi:hypothetical protein